MKISATVARIITCTSPFKWDLTTKFSHAFLLFFLILDLFILKNAWRVSEWLLSARHPPMLYSYFLYPTLQFPPGIPFEAGRKCGVDFGCLYFASKNYLTHGIMYDNASDPFLRPAVTFPPNLIFIVSQTLSHFNFPTSAFLSNIFQILVFLVVAQVYIHDSQKNRTTRLGMFSAIGFLIFCTPIGLTWFERAQTELFVASAALLLCKAMRDGRFSSFGWTGLLGSLKWTFFPFLAIVSIPYFFLKQPSPEGLHDRFRKVLCLGLVGLIPVLFVLPFGKTNLQYLDLILHFERDQAPQFISFGLYFSKNLAKIIPFTVPILFTFLAPLWRRSSVKNRSLLEILFWGTATFLSASFGTFAAEYKLVISLFLVPLIADGRSILFSAEQRKLSCASRLLGVVLLIYTFRVNTPFSWFNDLISYHRGLVPWIVVNLAILFCSANVLKARVFGYPYGRRRLER